jgi:hypothetical protein
LIEDLRTSGTEKFQLSLGDAVTVPLGDGLSGNLAQVGSFGCAAQALDDLGSVHISLKLTLMVSLSRLEEIVKAA